MFKKFFFLQLALIFSLSQVSHAGTELTNSTDYDGDGLGDLILYDSSIATFVIRKSSDLSVSEISIGNIGDTAAVADYNGDNKADLATFNPSTRVWNIVITGGSALSYTFGNVGDLPVPADYSNLGCAQIATYNPSTGDWTIGDCQGNSPATFNLGGPAKLPMPGDYDCDGRVDRAVYDRQTNEWTVRQSSTNTDTNFYFGLRGDIPLVSDFDGDSCDQAAVYRPTSKHFFINLSFTSGRVGRSSPPLQWGLPGDIPVMANVEGDSRTDYTIFRPSEAAYYITTSTSVFFRVPFSFGSEAFGILPADLASRQMPAPISAQRLQMPKVKGDYDRDGRAELSVATIDREADTTTWKVRHASGLVSTYTLNSYADAYVPADYNGDGQTQAAIVKVLESGNLEWRIKNPNNTETVELYGLNGDQPLVGDFDCDGKADKAVARKADGYTSWYIDRTATADLENYRFGFDTDNIFVADITGDGCDELIISREFGGSILWVYQNLAEGIDRVVYWGLAGDTPLTPSDLNGDGLDDFIVIRQFNGAQFIFVRFSDQDSLSESWPNFPFQVLIYGLEGDVPLTGDFGGINRAEFGVFRRNGVFHSGYILRDQGTDRLISFGSAGDTVIRPDGTAVVAPVSGGGTGGGGDTNGCFAGAGTENDFRDGAGGSLWKPVSEGVPNHAPAILLPVNYRGSDISILSSSGEVVSGIQRTNCCPNGNRAHFWASKTASELAQHKPITVKIVRPDNVTECRVVPEPTERVD